MSHESTDTTDSLSRRRFLRTTTATAGTLTLSVGASAAQQNPTRIALKGLRDGWVGMNPPVIEGVVNPTLDFKAGKEYVVEWKNADGLPHNFVILNANDEQMVRTDIISNQGQWQSVQFTAKEAMAEYYCEVHLVQMQGEVSFQGTPIGQQEADQQQQDQQQGQQQGQQPEQNVPPQLPQVEDFFLNTSYNESEYVYNVTAPGDIDLNATPSIDVRNAGNQTTNQTANATGNQTGNESANMTAFRQQRGRVTRQRNDWFATLLWLASLLGIGSVVGNAAGKSDDADKPNRFDER